MHICKIPLKNDHLFISCSFIFLVQIAICWYTPPNEQAASAPNSTTRRGMKNEPIPPTKCYRYGPTTLPSIVQASYLLITPPLHGFMDVVLYFPVPPLNIILNPIQGKPKFGKTSSRIFPTPCVGFQV